MLCLVVLFIVKTVLKPTVADPTPVVPVPPPVQLVRVVPPPPEINSPMLQAPEKSLVSEALDYFSGPCDPIIPKFRAAHNLRSVRPYIAEAIQENHIGHFNLGQVCDAFDFLINNWKQLDDPTLEELVCEAGAVWSNPSGDCDDFAVAISAGVSSISGVTRVTFAYDAQQTGHAYAEVCLGRIDPKPMVAYLVARYSLTDADSIHTRTDSGGYVYLNLDWTATHPGGPYFKAVNGVTYWPAIDYCLSF